MNHFKINTKAIRLNMCSVTKDMNDDLYLHMEVIMDGSNVVHGWNKKIPAGEYLTWDEAFDTTKQELAAFVEEGLFNKLERHPHTERKKRLL